MASLLNAIITVLYLAILGRVILDWLIIGKVMRPDNPIRFALISVTEPFLAPIRRYARVGMIDLSPMVAIFILIIIQNIVARSL